MVDDHSQDALHNGATVLRTKLFFKLFVVADWMMMFSSNSYDRRKSMSICLSHLCSLLTVRVIKRHLVFIWCTYWLAFHSSNGFFCWSISWAVIFIRSRCYHNGKISPLLATISTTRKSSTDLPCCASFIANNHWRRRCRHTPQCRPRRKIL